MVPPDVRKGPDERQPSHGRHVGHVVAVRVVPLVALVLGKK